MEGTRLGAKRPLFAEYIPAIEMQQVPCMSPSSFGTCEVKNWLEVLNTWIFEGRGWLIKG